MCPSGVMFASQVMCASRVRSGTRHTTLRQRRNTSLWRSHNITAATPQLHFFLPPAPKPWTDSNRHTVGAYIERPRANHRACSVCRPYNYKIIYKNMDATAFWTDLNHRNIFPTIWRFFVVRILSNRQMISSF